MFVRKSKLQIPVLLQKFALSTVLAIAVASGRAGAESDSKAAESASITIPVSSPAFVFSPGNWTGDKGRDGDLFRQTWYSGAYFRVTWSTPAAPKTTTLLLDTSTYGTEVKQRPRLTYNADGVWKSDVPCKGEITIEGLTNPGEHTLTVYLQNSEQANRWGSKGASGLNTLRVTGLRVDADSTPVAGSLQKKWMLEVGDSITEGVGTDGNLSAYSYFVGQAMQTQGYEYCVSACGFSGWICRGDATHDVPAYFAVSSSLNGKGGTYDDSSSRWNKIDANQSLLDSAGHLSAYGQEGQEPSIITINYGSNEAFTGANESDLQASITQGLAALRGAAPDAQIFVMIPFGYFSAPTIRSAVGDYKSAHPDDRKVSIIDLGPKIRQGMSDAGYWSGVHPNLRGHATFAARIVAAILGQANPAGQ